jgi:hypothetical protein
LSLRAIDPFLGGDTLDEHNLSRNGDRHLGNPANGGNGTVHANVLELGISSLSGVVREAQGLDDPLNLHLFREALGNGLGQGSLSSKQHSLFGVGSLSAQAIKDLDLLPNLSKLPAVSFSQPELQIVKKKRQTDLGAHLHHTLV